MVDGCDNVGMTNASQLDPKHEWFLVNIFYKSHIFYYNKSIIPLPYLGILTGKNSEFTNLVLWWQSFRR